MGKKEIKAGEVVQFGRDILRCVRSVKREEREDVPLGTSDGCCVRSNNQKVLFIKIENGKEEERV